MIVVAVCCTFCFENPGSTTKTIPSIVREVSAMLVLTTTLRPGQILRRGERVTKNGKKKEGKE